MCLVKPVICWLVVASAVSVPLTLTHAVEDFSVGIHQRFGLPLLVAGFLLSLGYAAQVAGAALSARDHRWGQTWPEHPLHIVAVSVRNSLP